MYSSYHVPGLVSSAFCVLIHLPQNPVRQVHDYHQPLFADKENKTQRVYVTG